MRRWMPSTAAPIWLLTGLLLTAFPVLNFVYWPQVLKSGVLPAESDSIGIPMFGSILVAIIASPFILGIAWLCLRRYNPETHIGSFRRDRPYRSAASTLVFGGIAAIALICAVHDAAAVQPWYEYLWSVYFSLWVPWLLALRASLIAQEDAINDRFASSGF